MIDIKPGTLIRFKGEAVIDLSDDVRVVTYGALDREAHTWFADQVFMFLELQMIRPKHVGTPAWFIHVLTPNGIDKLRLFNTRSPFESQIEVLT